MNNVNYISDKTALLKCYYWASMPLPSAFLRSAFGLLLRNRALTGVSSFLCCNLITFTGKGWRATKEINWRHATVRTGAWARAE